MTAAADHLLDRRRLRRSVTLWRSLAALLAIAALVGLGFAASGRGSIARGGPHVARVSIQGFISGDRPTLRLIERVAETESVRAVIVSIDSPGGSAPGAEALHEGLRRLAAKKPIVSVVQNTAASGGYIAALAADRIFARQTSFVGSIGVLIQVPNVTGLLDKLGVGVEEVKSSPLKAEPSPFKAPTEEGRLALQALIADSYAWFRGLVGERRGLDEALLARVADGRVFTGRQAVELKLVDALGGEAEALDWLAANRGVTRDLPVRDWQRDTDRNPLTLFSLAVATAHGLGFDEVARVIERAAAQGEGSGDGGVLALWRPSASR